MASKFGLGKGLGALIPERLAAAGQGTSTVRDAAGGAVDGEGAGSRSGIGPDREDLRILGLDLIEPNPSQPRKEFPEESIRELASSIARHGLIQPILVEEYRGPEELTEPVPGESAGARRASGGDGPGTGKPDGIQAGGGQVRYRIVAGERRFRAARLAGLREIPAIVRSYSPEKRFAISLIENIQRENLNPVEEAEAYRSLMELSGSTQDEVADAVGKSRSAIANSVRLLKLPRKMLDSLRTGGITPGHARALLALPEETARDRLFDRILRESISVRQAEELVQPRAEGRPAGRRKASSADGEATAPRDPDLVAVEQRLIQSLGTKVSIRGDARKGVVEVQYYSLEDLERIIEILEL